MLREINNMMGVEYFLVYLFLLGLFLLSLKRKDSIHKSGEVDLNMSKALKGIACIMILTGHWGTLRFSSTTPWNLPLNLWTMSANIALTWFMFFSGYGLSLKKSNEGQPIIPIWLRRLKKVYFPLLFACLVSMFCYTLLPSMYSIEELKELRISEDIFYLHHLSWDNFIQLWPHAIGWKDWYVLCIMMFYSLFYLSLWLERKTKYTQTTLLFILLCIYYIWAFRVFGKEEGHFFRYCWIFFISHVIAKWNTFENKSWPIFMCICLSVTLLVEGKVMLLAFFIAMAGIVLISIINQRYEVKGHTILFLGSISYFFYLLHTRIVYTLMVYLDINSMILWILLTTIISWSVFIIYNKLSVLFK